MTDDDTRPLRDQHFDSFDEIREAISVLPVPKKMIVVHPDDAHAVEVALQQIRDEGLYFEVEVAPNRYIERGEVIVMNIPEEDAPIMHELELTAPLLHWLGCPVYRPRDITKL